MAWARMHGKTWSFETNFNAHHWKSCSIPQDKVYALLGMVHGRDEILSSLPIVDYSQDSWKLLHQLLNSCEFEEPLDFVHTFADQVILPMESIDQQEQHDSIR